MKTVSLKNGLLHVETPLGIVNITVGLTDRIGRRVESIEVIAPRLSGEKKIIRRGYYNTRLIELKGVRA
jgi:hypothetical protein